MPDIPALLLADIKKDVVSLCRLWTVTRADGVVLRFTDLDDDVVFAGNKYRADIGFDASAILMALDTNQQGMELTVFLNRKVEGSDDDRFYQDDIEARKYDGAIAKVSFINWMAPTHGESILFGGKFGPISIDDGVQAKITINPLDTGDKFIQTEIYSVSCRADLGDVRCKVDIESLKRDFTVTDLQDDQRVVSDTITEEFDFWKDGTLLWLTGSNQGRAYEVATSIIGQLVLFLPTQFPIKVGDTATVYPGCDKSLSTCRELYDNVKNYRGEPFVPGEDTIADNGVTG